MNWIWLDMDGTFVNLYGVPGWLNYLEICNPTPYIIAPPLVRLSLMARLIHKAQEQGYKVGIVSWTSKTGTNAFNDEIAEAKQAWLNAHLPSVQFDAIHIVEYGTPKHEVCADCPGCLFDDEAKNRDNWNLGEAYDVDNLLEVLKEILN